MYAAEHTEKLSFQYKWWKCLIFFTWQIHHKTFSSFFSTFSSIFSSNSIIDELPISDWITSFPMTILVLFSGHFQGIFWTFLTDVSFSNNHGMTRLKKIYIPWWICLAYIQLAFQSFIHFAIHTHTLAHTYALSHTIFYLYLLYWISTQYIQTKQ